MADGLIALTGWQAGLETVRGTLVAATRIQPMTATLHPIGERFAPQEDRNSFEDYYRSVQTKTRVEVSGAVANATFEDAPWFFQSFIAGGITGVLSAATVYTYTFLPTLTADDLKTLTIEGFTDTSAWAVPFCVGKKLDITYQRGQPVTFGMDLLGQRMITQAKTAALPQRVTEDIADGLTTAFIDTTTIGTTAVANVLAAKLTLDNMWEPIYPINGLAYPSKFVRSRRHLNGEVTLEFDTTTEYDAFMTSLVRKMRLKSTGSIIPGSTGNILKSMAIDFYTQGWDTLDFGRQGGIWTIKVLGRSTNPGAGASWSAVCVNGLVTLP